MFALLPVLALALALAVPVPAHAQSLTVPFTAGDPSVAVPVADDEYHLPLQAAQATQEAPAAVQKPVVEGPAAPPKLRAWSGSLSAGISITSGNKDTSNFNASFDLAHDPKRRNVFKTDALYLRGKSEKNVTGDQLRFGFYDEYRFNTRFFVFGQARYLRDRFKDVDYLVAPSTGMGYKVYDNAASSLGFAAGLGGVFEKESGRRTAPSGSLNIDQKLSHKVSSVATITQAIAGLWKTNDFSDSLYTMRATLAASITQRAQLKVEVLDTYKNRVPTGTKKNDVALVTGLVYKI